MSDELRLRVAQEQGYIDHGIMRVVAPPPEWIVIEGKVKR